MGTKRQSCDIVFRKQPDCREYYPSAYQGQIERGLECQVKQRYNLGSNILEAVFICVQNEEDSEN